MKTINTIKNCCSCGDQCSRLKLVKRGLKTDLKKFKNFPNFPNRISGFSSGDKESEIQNQCFIFRLLCPWELHSFVDRPCRPRFIYCGCEHLQFSRQYGRMKIENISVLRVVHHYFDLFTRIVCVSLSEIKKTNPGYCGRKRTLI